MSIGFSNELFRECFGKNSNVPMLNQASNICLTTYVTFLQNKLETVVQQSLSGSGQSPSPKSCANCGSYYDCDEEGTFPCTSENEYWKPRT